jgi:ring-1,2-phenylacetyl-CoA epoxidase subunit PaaC
VVWEELRFQALLRHADDRLVLGHRLSEWCGHGPTLEEDIALSNVALDLLGQAKVIFEQSIKTDSKKRSVDDLIYFREIRGYRNVILVEQPNGDFACTILRQYFFDVFNRLWLNSLQSSIDKDLSSFARSAIKEAIYHERHTKSWVVRLGDGTKESNERIQEAVSVFYPLSYELFSQDEIDQKVFSKGLLPNTACFEKVWKEEVALTLLEATLQFPKRISTQTLRGREGRHTEHLDRILSEMQSLARAHPGASW